MDDKARVNGLENLKYKIVLSKEEMNRMEELAKYADIQTIREWEKPMK